MFRRKFIDRLRKKYRIGGKLQDPYLSIGGRSINTDNGTRYGTGAKLSAPILESIKRGSDASGLRFETDFAGTNSGPVSISNDERGKAYNASIGLRGYHNKYINRNNTLSLNSNIGAGIGTGDENGDGQMNPFVDANLSLLKSGRTRKGTNVSGGPTLSYGTEGSPSQGLRLGLEGNYGRLSGNAEYDFTNKTPRVGASLNFQNGGMYNQMKQYGSGGVGSDMYTDSSNNTDTSNEENDVSNPGGGGNPYSQSTSGITGNTLPPNPSLQKAGNFLLDEVGMPILQGASSMLGTGDITTALNRYNKADDEGGMGGASKAFFGPILKNQAESAITGGVGRAARNFGGSFLNSKAPKNVGKRIASAFGFQDGGIRHEDGGMYGQMQQYQMGGQQLPGGEMQPIPGSDAVQFNGQSHDQGGIMLDPQTEVEGGETMDQVTMAKNGGKRRDYFFSDHLKKGGVSYAEMHKDILSEGGDQEKINYLAQMQEKAAGRPTGSVQTAENGGIKQYVTGGVPTFGSEVDDGYIEGESYLDQLLRQLNKPKETPLMLQPLPAAAPPPKKETKKYTSPFATIGEEKEFQDWANANNYNTKGYGWGESSQDAYNKGFADFQASKIVPEPVSETEEVEELSLQEINRNDRRMKGPELDQRLYDNLQLKIDRGDILTDKQQADYDRVVLALGENRTTDNYVRRNQRKEFDNLQDKANKKKDTPRLAMIAGATQLLPAAYEMFNKQPAAEQANYTQGFTSPIIAEKGKASKLERVNFNNERSTNASDMRGVNRFIETSGGGPANIINKMASYSKKQKQDSKINAAETRANQQIANQEAQLEQQMAVNNMSRAQQASTTNAQLSRAETARMDQIGVTNAAARQKVKDDEEYMKYQGVSATASGVGGLLGDMMAYQAQERMAKTIGTEGIYKRDQLRTLYKKQNPNATEAEVNAFITQYNS